MSGGSLRPRDWTAMTPTPLTTRSKAWITRGKNMNDSIFSALASCASEAPRIIVPTISAAMLSNTSAIDPAQLSPTLSPTKSAMTAGLRGSSSGD